MKRHYHVFVSMPGYLPDNEPELHRTRKGAEAAAKWHADGYRDVIYETNRENAANGLARVSCVIVASSTPAALSLGRNTSLRCV